MNEQVQLITDFIDEKLQGNIYGLVSYDIAQLRGDRKYGEGKGRYFDCDDTNLSRAIFTVVFDGVWKDLNSRTLEQGKYRGDTINSFNTIFGRPADEGGFFGLNHFEPDDQLVARVTRFHSLYHTIGNMVVLPNAYIGKYSLNTFRGSYYKWRDYIDQFVKALHDYLTDKGDIENEVFLQLMELNKDDFNKYHEFRGFKLLMNRLLLDYCLDEQGGPRHLFDVVYYWDKKLTRESYIKHITKYLDFCESFIENRGKRIVEILESKIR